MKADDQYAKDLSKALKESFKVVKTSCIPSSFSILPVKSITGSLKTPKTENHTIVIEL